MAGWGRRSRGSCRLDLLPPAGRGAQTPRSKGKVLGSEVLASGWCGKRPFTVTPGILEGYTSMI